MKEVIKENKSSRYTEEELMIRLKVFIGVCLALTLIGIVFVVLFSIIFVAQPLTAISPIDAKFFELIIPVATFLTGTLSGIMLAGTGKDAAMSGMKSYEANKVAQAAATAAPSVSAPIAPPAPPKPPAPPAPPAPPKL